MPARLSDPLVLPCGTVLPNRLAKAAMTEGLADVEGRATQRNVRLYERWGASGAGLLLTGNVLIDHRFLERPRNVVVERGRDTGMLREVAQAATAHGAQCWVQINHPGRQAGLGAEQFVGPSAVPVATGSAVMTRALSTAEIGDLVDRFSYVAETVQACGFTGVQVHAAHGYLNSQFLSPLTNLRTDEWGGSLENRARLLLSSVRAVRKAVGPDFAVSVKLNSADFQKGGFTEDESLTVIGWLEEAGIDLLEISGGNYESMEMVGFSNDGSPQPERRASTVAREAYFVTFADRIRPHTRVPLMVTGGFRSRAAMDAALVSGALDVVGLGRPFCADPAVATRLLSGAISEASFPDRAPHIPREAMPEADDMTHFIAQVQSGICYNYNRIRDMADGTATASESDWLHNLRNHEAVEGTGAADYHARFGG
ncbi:NADH:flavin oxidoreductase/NADH oxidase family protein [Novosphingobium lentum]|uniref:NADH:flavin oxidoreductase/NADH oxidase family protein n=1 Tax=Novosphingobium lentum TaxID=145287 RepID=UPI00082D62A3|nr:NADH:flavin oxidoreductase/NADH oxidase family protein [Novosphingobium lentum]